MTGSTSKLRGSDGRFNIAEVNDDEDDLEALKGGLGYLVSATKHIETER